MAAILATKSNGYGLLSAHQTVVVCARTPRRGLCSPLVPASFCSMPETTHQRLTTPREALDEELRRHSPLLKEMAHRYIWWMKPEEAIDYPARIAAQVMNIGTLRDANRLADALGGECLGAVLRYAEAGQFNARSWHYWHYRLGLAKVDEVPPLPVRRIE